MRMRDIDIRLALRETMNRLHEGEPNTLIIEELGLCQGLARVDMAVVNGSLHGYEIKSERDTLTRLQGQTDIYNRALDFVTIVTAQTHVSKIERLVPQWWGIWIVIQQAVYLRIEEKREPHKNPFINPFALAQLLWRDEALQALADRDLASGMRNKPREKLWRRLAELETEDLGKIVRERLKQRKDWRVVAQPS